MPLDVRVTLMPRSEKQPTVFFSTGIYTSVAVVELFVKIALIVSQIDVSIILARKKNVKIDTFNATESHGDVRCTFTKTDIYSEVLLTVKRSAAYMGVVGIAAMKEKYDGQRFLRAVFVFINKIDIK